MGHTRGLVWSLNRRMFSACCSRAFSDRAFGWCSVRSDFLPVHVLRSDPHWFYCLTCHQQQEGWSGDGRARGPNNRPRDAVAGTGRLEPLYLTKEKPEREEEAVPAPAAERERMPERERTPPRRSCLRSGPRPATIGRKHVVWDAAALAFSKHVCCDRVKAWCVDLSFPPFCYRQPGPGCGLTEPVAFGFTARLG